MDRARRETTIEWYNVPKDIRKFQKANFSGNSLPIALDAIMWTCCMYFPERTDMISCDGLGLFIGNNQKWSLWVTVRLGFV